MRFTMILAAMLPLGSHWAAAASANQVTAAEARAAVDKYIPLLESTLQKFSCAGACHHSLGLMVYGMARELSDGDCWVITAHAWDAAGARRAGLRSVWLSNREKRWNNVMPHPDLQASGFDEAMETLLCYSGAGSHAAVQHA